MNLEGSAMELTVGELEEKTGFSRRTIHFYVKLRVIPPPHGAGVGARYGEEHYLRLRLLPSLQGTHLKLEGIRHALDSMTVEEMRQRVAGLPPSERILEKEELDRLLGGFLTTRRPAPLPSKKPGTSPGAGGRNYSFLEMAGGGATARGQAAAGTTPPAQWERFQVAEGLEVHVRTDVAARYRKLVAELAKRLGSTT